MLCPICIQVLYKFLCDKANTKIARYICSFSRFRELDPLVEIRVKSPYLTPRVEYGRLGTLALNLPQMPLAVYQTRPGVAFGKVCRINQCHKMKVMLVLDQHSRKIPQRRIVKVKDTHQLPRCVRFTVSTQSSPCVLLSAEINCVPTSPFVH